MPSQDDQQPATRADLREGLERFATAITTDLRAEIRAGEERAVERLTAATTALREDIRAGEERAVERAREMQTEILRGIEAFARGNFARMHRIETSDADTNARIAALEERVFYLEIRRLQQGPGMGFSFSRSPV